jgi:hypothetical protein
LKHFKTVAKIRVPRVKSQGGQLTLIMLGLFLGLAAIGGAQVAFCKWKIPSQLWTVCLAPLWHQRGKG